MLIIMYTYIWFEKEVNDEHRLTEWGNQRKHFEKPHVQEMIVLVTVFVLCVCVSGDWIKS